MFPSSSGMRIPMRASAGFTLIELLVVMAIIGILAGILMPVLSGMKTKARIKQAETDAKTLAMAIRAYHTEYNRWPIPEADASAGYGVYGKDEQNQVIVGRLVATDGANTRRINFFDPPDPTQKYGDPFTSNAAYRIEVSVTGNYVRVWSCGLNCKDNNGGGDDIASDRY